MKPGGAGAAFLVIGALILGGCGNGEKKAEKTVNRAAVPFLVEALVATPEAVPQSVRAPGTVEAYESVQVVARVSGVLERLLVAEGDTVAVGAPIAAIDTARYRLARTSAQAAQAKAEAVLEDARQLLARREVLIRESQVTQEAVDQARNRVRQAEADVASAAAALERAALDLNDATVVAPVAGVVQARSATSGAWLNTGAPLATLVVRDPMQVRFPVAVDAAANLASGMPVTVQLRGDPETVAGTIRLVSEIADPATRQVAVLARVTDPGHRLRPGAFVTVTAVLSPTTVIPLPPLAVHIGERGPEVAVIEADGDGLVARLRHVVTAGEAVDGRILVRSGVKAGERLVARAADGLSDGMRVRLPAETAKP